MKRPTRFFGLHAHSGFSTFDGLGYPQEHINFCLDNNLDGWALTDHGHMNGFAHAYLHAEKLRKAGANLKFIPGCEMYVHPDLELWRAQYEIKKAAKKGDKSAINAIISGSVIQGATCDCSPTVSTKLAKGLSITADNWSVLPVTIAIASKNS